MKKSILPLLTILFLVLGLASCNNSSTDGNLLGNNGTTINFTMGTQQGPNGGTQFTWVPQVDVKVTMLILGTTGFSDTIVDNSGQTYTANSTWAYPEEYTGVQSGQQWQFLFSGTTVSNNQAFNSSISYTIP